MKEYFDLKYDFAGYSGHFVGDYLHLLHYGYDCGLYIDNEQTLKDDAVAARRAERKLLAEGHTKEELDEKYTKWLATKKQQEQEEYFKVRYNAEGYHLNSDEHIHWYDIDLGLLGNTYGIISTQRACEVVAHRKQLETQLLNHNHSQEQLESGYAKWLQLKEQEDKERDGHGQSSL